MKCTTIINPEREEVLIYAREKTKLIEDIEQLVSDHAFELVGYKDRCATILNAADICCFIVEDNKVYALCGNERFQLKSRLYRLEEHLSHNFVKINQSCIANIKMIKRFDASISGSLIITFKNGYTDYVSRRNLKYIKERLGF